MWGWVYSGVRTGWPVAAWVSLPVGGSPTGGSPCGMPRFNFMCRKVHRWRFAYPHLWQSRVQTHGGLLSHPAPRPAIRLRKSCCGQAGMAWQAGRQGGKQLTKCSFQSGKLMVDTRAQ